MLRPQFEPNFLNSQFIKGSSVLLYVLDVRILATTMMKWFINVQKKCKVFIYNTYDYSFQDIWGQRYMSFKSLN